MRAKEMLVAIKTERNDICPPSEGNKEAGRISGSASRSPSQSGRPGKMAPGPNNLHEIPLHHGQQPPFGLAPFTKPAIVNVRILAVQHSFRHTHATLLGEVGESLCTAQAILGHSDLKTTLNVYTHAIPESRKRAVDKVAGLVFPRGPKFSVDTENRRAN